MAWQKDATFEESFPNFDELSINLLDDMDTLDTSGLTDIEFSDNESSSTATLKNSGDDDDENYGILTVGDGDPFMSHVSLAPNQGRYKIPEFPLGYQSPCHTSPPPKRPRKSPLIHRDYADVNHDDDEPVAGNCSGAGNQAFLPCVKNARPNTKKTEQEKLKEMLAKPRTETAFNHFRLRTNLKYDGQELDALRKKIHSPEYMEENDPKIRNLVEICQQFDLLKLKFEETADQRLMEIRAEELEKKKKEKKYKK